MKPAIGLLAIGVFVDAGVTTVKKPAASCVRPRALEFIRYGITSVVRHAIERHAARSESCWRDYRLCSCPVGVSSSMILGMYLASTSARSLGSMPFCLAIRSISRLPKTSSI